MYDMWMDWYVPDDPNDDKLLHRYDYNNFYASKTHKSVKRQCILLGWANEFDSGSDDKANGWAGIYVCDVVAPHSMDQLVALSMS
jgi:beta-fructofuranosidase